MCVCGGGGCNAFKLPVFWLVVNYSLFWPKLLYKYKLPDVHRALSIGVAR